MTTSTKQVTCRYFLHGVCREGSRCLFSHDLNNSKPSTICKFYQRGMCAYGERCRYDHIKPSARGGGAAADQSAAGGGVGGGTSVTSSRKKTLRFRDQGLTVDDTCGSPAEMLGSEVTAGCPQSYVDAIRTGLGGAAQEPGGASQAAAQLCPYAAAGHCSYEDNCPYLHGDVCDVCGMQVLHPHDPEQRNAHEKMCLLMFEADMEKAFAAQLSQDKVCSICMEVVVQKTNLSERRFGILSSCSHTFCLTCIRQWRCTRNFSNQIIKSCPECRVISEFVIPSAYWVENQDDKDHLINLFKSGVSKKACKYFNQGRGSCPFGARCLYLHAFPDGTRAEPALPRKQLGSEGNVRFMNSVRLWDFIEEREQRSAPPPALSSFEDDITEMRELFMQMSGPSQNRPETPSTADY
ncbi:probable E3 ubiquitin-protein ligase makorin-2 isoform X2 [Thalassophryne amazonica]|uniref:probable E3 ubiquitin-protein ligase makorin-2 isoform X2 n=1 Tax=Thalassophryne amazonica TaxID=390379 RepID=UPI001470E431|nr:probable E3 ubiquitin-protein ligase makorin-2 isoform X2 [Thalassophryne amazonica]